MTTRIAISGDVGSGKSTVARDLGRVRAMQVASGGAIMRGIAADRGLSTLEANHLAEDDERIDAEIDAELAALGESSESYVFDSRMAWHFIPSALKVHLSVDPAVGADRVLAERTRLVEQYHSYEAALSAIEARRTSEQLRFREKYGVDIGRLRNYDVVIDTTDATVESVVELVIGYVDAGSIEGLQLYVSPKRVVPTSDAVRELARRQVPAQQLPGREDLLVLGYTEPYFFALAGYEPLSAALQAGDSLISGFLDSEGTEEIVGGLSATEYLLKEVRPGWIYDWEAAHDFRFRSYPSLMRT